MEGLFAVSCSVVDPPGVEPGSTGDSPVEVANDWAPLNNQNFTGPF